MATPAVESRIDNLDRYRRQVLSHPLARGLTPEETEDYVAGLPKRRYPSVAYAERAGRPCVQPRGGFPLFEAQARLTRQLSEAGADFVPLTIDSYTRHNQYDTATQLLRRSEEEEKNYLNGYPLVSHGHELTRELYKGLDKPVSLRHGTPDARLLVELALASGIVEIEGGSICYCVPYSEGFPLDRCLLYWQYVDRLCATLSRPGLPIHRESFGPLTATLVPPAVVVTIQVLELLLAAEQGVTSFAVSFGQTGSVVQDLATARVLQKAGAHWLQTFGFNDVRCHLVYHQWMGQFPHQRERAAALICGSTVLAGLMNADKIVVKTVDEALGVPRAEINAEAVDTVRYLQRIFSCSQALTSPAVEREVALIESEADTLLNAIFDLPGTVFWESVARAFRMGWIDIPFAPHSENANALISKRDGDGSIRIAEAGRMPMRPADARIEKEMLASRSDADDKTYLQMLADINMMT
jgi:methylaspartate mutase epsilon subunit